MHILPAMHLLLVRQDARDLSPLYRAHSFISNSMAPRVMSTPKPIVSKGVT